MNSQKIIHRTFSSCATTIAMVDRFCITHSHKLKFYTYALPIISNGDNKYIGEFTNTVIWYIWASRANWPAISHHPQATYAHVHLFCVCVLRVIMPPPSSIVHLQAVCKLPGTFESTLFNTLTKIMHALLALLEMEHFFWLAVLPFEYTRGGCAYKCNTLHSEPANWGWES